MLILFSRYTVAGALGTAVHYTIMAIVLTTSDVPAIATGVGALLGALVNFVLCRRWVFATRLSPAQDELLRFGLIALLCALINACVVGMLHLPIGVWPAQVLATTVTLIVGFRLNRRWSFGLSTRM